MKQRKILLIVLTIFLTFFNINKVYSKEVDFTFNSSDYSYDELKKLKIFNLCTNSLYNPAPGATTSVCSQYGNKYSPKKNIKCYAVCTVTIKNPWLEFKHAPGDPTKTYEDMQESISIPQIAWDGSKFKVYEDVFIRYTLKKDGKEHKLLITSANLVGNINDSYFQKLDIKFAEKGFLGLAYDDFLKEKCKNPKGKSLKNICKQAKKVTDKEKKKAKGTYTTDDTVKKATKEADKKNNDSEMKKTSTYKHYKYKKSLLDGENKISSCEELLGDEVIEIIQTIVNIVRVSIPLLLIVYGVIDFGKAIFSSEEGDMKKAQTRFIKRLIIGITFFLIPVVIKLLLKAGHAVWGDVIKNSICGIEF